MKKTTHLNNLLDSRHLLNCRICEGPFSTDKFELKPTPLANELSESKNEALTAQIFPLTLVMCEKCKHVQLQDIVSAERLFRDYKYKSGTSSTFVKHFEELANQISKIIDPNDLILEVGSNDGTLLQALKNLGYSPIGIEPGLNLAEETQRNGLDVICGLFDVETLERSSIDHGTVKLIVGNNVFAHIDKLKEAFELVESLLTHDGIFIFEVAHLLQLVKKTLFDTIYHEHMSYHSVTSLISIFQNVGLEIFKVDQIPSHGGSIRVFATKRTSSRFQELYDPNSLRVILDEEIEWGINSTIFMQSLNASMGQLRKEANELLNILKDDYRIIGYGAPAKLVTFISEFNLDKYTIEFIVDDNPEKQNKFTPGSAIRIVDSSEFLTNIFDKPFAILIFPWNLNQEIYRKLKEKVSEGNVAIWLLPKPEMIRF